MISTSEAVERAIHFVLQDSADRLKGEELVRIIELAHQAEAIVHLSHASWQILIGVPERNCRRLEQELSSMGFVCTIPEGPMNEISTFVLGHKHDDAVL